MSNHTDISSSSVETPKLQASPRRMKWQAVYFLLAVFNIVTICLCLLLSHQLGETNRRTIQRNLQWVAWLKQCDVLSQQAGEVNNQGSDVLTSHNVPKESHDRDVALTVFNHTLSKLHADLMRNSTPDNAPVLLNDCSKTHVEMDELTELISSVFSLIRNGQLEQAQTQITTMNRDYDDVLRSLDTLRSHLRKQRDVYLQGQIAEADALQRYEYLLGLLITVMVIGVFAYGASLDRHVTQSETTIRKTQDQYRLLVEQTTDGILLLDDDWNIRFANQAACQMFGYSHDEITHLNLKATYPPEDQDLAARFKQELRTREVSNFERTAIRRDGSSFLSEVIARRLEPSGSQWVCRDITKRKQEEESRLQLAAIVESSEDAIIASSPDGTIVSWNMGAQRLLGYTADEAKGLLIGVIIPPKHWEGVHAVQAKIRAGERINPFDAVAITKGASRISISLSLSPIKSTSGKIVGTSAILRDVTERKRHQDQLHLQSAALEAAANGIVITDSRGTILWVNKAFTTLTGYSREEAIGKKPSVLKSGKHDGAYYRRLWEIITAGGIWRGEITNRRKDGSLYIEDMTITPVRDANGEVSRFVAIKQDVTQQRAAEQSLRIRDDAFAASISAMATSDLAGNLTYVNGAFVKMFGCHSDEELLGKPFAPLFVDAAALESALRILHSQGHWTGELSGRRVDGQSLDVFISSSVASDPAGQPLCLVASLFDITERKRTAESLQESNRSLKHALANLKAAEGQVIQQERLRALGTMASGIAHDFNNALTGILGFSELLLQRPEILADKAKARSFIGLMNTAAKDAGEVVNRLREFYRHREENEVLLPVNMNELVSEAIAMTQPKWKAETEARGVSVKVHTDLQEIPPITGNAANLREAVTNLIFNAVDAMPQGGTITIHTHLADGFVVLEIRDTGTGMTPEVRQRCLEPFFTTKGTHGTGLGLSMVYGILQRHQGKVDIQTEVGEGTAFIIRLPVPTAKPSSGSEALPVNVSQHLHVLVVDDEAVVRQVVGEYLKNDGHIVESANCGLDGLDKFRKGRFDLVLLDRAMPDMSGDQLAAAVKSDNPAMPVIMLTGFGSMMDAVEEKPAGIDLVVGKPVTIDNLRKAIAATVARN